MASWAAYCRRNVGGPAADGQKDTSATPCGALAPRGGGRHCARAQVVAPRLHPVGSGPVDALVQHSRLLAEYLSNCWRELNIIPRRGPPVQMEVQNQCVGESVRNLTALRELNIPRLPAATADMSVGPV